MSLWLTTLLLLAPKPTEKLWTEMPPTAAAPGLPPSQTFARLAKSVSPAVVNLIAFSSAIDNHAGSPDTGKPHSRGQGTGFIIHKSGLILTNWHVVQGANDIRVHLSDGRELSGHLVGRDERTDLALVSVDAPAPLPVAPLGNSDKLQIGEWVVAIGNPFGLDHTVTIGIVSAKGRRDVRQNVGLPPFEDFIQTDASINPGNSGGPLMNSRGEVIGINTAVTTHAQGIGFAIPVNMAKIVIPLLKKFGRAPRRWIGIASQPINESLKKAFRLPELRGALISDVATPSPAADVGLRVGDVIWEIDGHPLGRADDFMWTIANSPAGKKVHLVVLRKTKRQEVTIVPVDSPEEPPPSPPSSDAEHKSPFGMTVAEVTPSIARELGDAQLTGVVVLSVESSSPAVEAGVERGDLVVQIGDDAIRTLEDYGRLIRAVPTGEMIRLLVQRSGKNLWVAFSRR